MSKFIWNLLSSPIRARWQIDNANYRYYPSIFQMFWISVKEISLRWKRCAIRVHFHLTIFNFFRQIFYHFVFGRKNTFFAVFFLVFYCKKSIWNFSKFSKIKSFFFIVLLWWNVWKVFKKLVSLFKSFTSSSFASMKYIFHTLQAVFRAELTNKNTR